jgi:hypothetical protein
VGICFCFIQSHYMYGGPPLKYTKITTRSPQWDIKQETIYIFRPGGTCGTLGICFFFTPKSLYRGSPTYAKITNTVPYYAQGGYKN